MSTLLQQPAPTFKLSSPANRDIDAIWDAVFERSLSLDIADKVIAKIFEAFGLLSEHPQAGHTREDLTDKPLKFWSVYHYLIAYVPDASPTEIVAVIHGARDVPVLLEER
jgi:plasmid stabilization system protein ParE